MNDKLSIGIIVMMILLAGMLIGSFIETNKFSFTKEESKTIFKIESKCRD